MLKTGLSILVLLLVSGCATFFGDEQGPAGEANLEQTQNKQLKVEASALRDAVRQRQDELDQLNAGSSE